jgi:poly-beta-1,6-N-acetyl-D-glucosamine synthase
VLTVLNVLSGHDLGFVGVGLAWGIAISMVATVQLVVAVTLSYPYDHWDVRAMVLGPIYPMLFWLVSASAAINQQITALIRGPRARRVVWDIPRERLDSTSP